eukprot:TRINITY_DN33528_c0_g1_i1.p2 TRINITY_DN33528_c0_g1~~TRINITY_DN33528_c0_g1_i1.p2  ORF type:complete len:134 (+),score=33.43 TRINITY_DN33528_c0_g1_i1:47-403(+)
MAGPAAPRAGAGRLRPAPPRQPLGLVWHYERMHAALRERLWVRQNKQNTGFRQHRPAARRKLAEAVYTQPPTTANTGFRGTPPPPELLTSLQHAASQLRRIRPVARVPVPPSCPLPAV